jgi:hypothetical protein
MARIFPSSYNRLMRFRTIVVLILGAALSTNLLTQDTAKVAAQAEPKSVTVPITLDHNRIIIDVDLPLSDGSTKRVRGWVDNGNSDLNLSRRVATLMGLTVTCGEQECSAPPPREIMVAGMSVALDAVKEAKIPLKPVAAAAVMFPGLSAEISIPSSVLRNYDVLINFPGHELTIAQPGNLKFVGVKAKAIVNAGNGLIQIPSQIENKKYNLALDVGSSVSFLSDELFEKLAATHADWPHMTGAIGPANLWGLDDEPKWKLMRVERVQFGPLFLTNVAAVDFPKDRMAFFERRAGIPTAGLLGADALLNYRIGIDYAHSIVYFDIGRLFNFPAFDVVGLTLRPEDDGRFTILGIADYDGKPSIAQGSDGVQVGDHLVAVDGISVLGSTMSQIWSMLGGTPGKERVLTVERGGKQFTVAAKVQHFLGEAPEKDVSNGKSKKH